MKYILISIIVIAMLYGLVGIVNFIIDLKEKADDKE
jgi:hypothetical protein